MPREPLHQGSDAKQTDLAEIPALLTTGRCYNTALGSSSTQRCSKGWRLTSRNTKEQMVKPGVGDSCLGGKLCCRSLCWSSPPPGRMVAKGTELLPPSGLQALMCVGELLQEQAQGQGCFTRELVLRTVYVFILSSPGAKASVAAGCYTDHARASAQLTKCTCKEAITLTLLFEVLLPITRPCLWQKNKTPRWVLTFPNRHGSSCASVRFPKEEM